MFQKLFKKDKFFWITYIITVLASYGFVLTNFSIGIDDEALNLYIDNGSLIMQGRPGLPLLSRIFNIYEFLPFWHDFIAIIIITLSILVWIYLFEKVSDNTFSNTQAAIFACISISYPLIAKSFIFTISTTGLGLCFLLSGITLVFFYNAAFGNNNKNQNFFLAVSIFIFALLIGENSAVITVLGFFIILFLQSNKSKACREFSYYGIIFVKFLFMVVISLIARKVVNYIVADLYNLKLAKYVNSYILYDFQNIFLSVTTAFENIVLHFFVNATKDINIIVYRLSAISICLCAIYLFIKKRNIYALLFAVGLILSPIVLCFITGNQLLPSRTLVPISYFAGFGISLLYMTLKDIKIFKVDFKYFVYILAFYIVLYQSKEMNVTFYTDYLNYKLDVEKMNTIMLDLQEEGNGNLTKPVMFIGIPPNYNLDYSKTELNSMFRWDRQTSSTLELSSDRIYSFINMHGYSIQRPTDYDEKKIRQDSFDIPVYPSKGYIKDCGDYLLIKLGIPKWEYSNLGKEDFEKKFTDFSELNANICIDNLSNENKLFSISGWGLIKNVPSRECIIQISLTAENNQYILYPDVIGGADITAYMNDGINYDSSRFAVYWNNSVCESGNYEVNFILETNGEKVYVKTGQNILIQ